MKRFKYDTVEKIYKHYCSKCETWQLQSNFYSAYSYICKECSKKEKRHGKKCKGTPQEVLDNNKRIKETIARLKNEKNNQ